MPTPQWVIDVPLAIGKAYQAVFGENLQKDDWLAILNEAAAASIVEYLGSTIYKIHPALPWFLRKRLNQQVAIGISQVDNTLLGISSQADNTHLGINSQANKQSPLKWTEDDGDSLSSRLETTSAISLGIDSEVILDAQQRITELEKQLLIFYAYLADIYHKELISNAKLASFILRVEEPNLLQNLRLAEQQQEWKYAQSILQLLGEVYERLGRKSELKALR